MAAQTTRKLFLALAFAMPLLVYLLTLAPGLTWAHHGADGGDLVTAAYTLGVPHPSGYPTYILLAWSFTRLPLGDVAWRVNLLSALSTATAAALIYWTVVRLANEGTDTPVIIAGLGAAWSYAFAPLVWSQALIAEVYGLAGLWTALILGLTVFPLHQRGRLLALGLVWSLGLGVHLILISLASVIVWAVWQAVRPARRLGVFRPLAFVILGFLAGLLVWLYLPLRAGQGGVTWGQPKTLEGFWWLVSGVLYRDYLFALPASALVRRLAAWAQTWGSGLCLTGVALATSGAVGLTSCRPGWLVATGLSFTVLNLYALGYNTTDSVVYLVPAFVIGSIWLGAGLADLFSRLREWGKAGRWLTPLMLAVALVSPAWTLARNRTALDLSGDHSAKSFCQAVMTSAPPRAILLTTTDRQTFALWYCQQVEGLRPDVAVVDEGLKGFGWYRAGLQRTHPDLWISDLGISQANASTPTILTDRRPHCQVHREAQTGWLDCQGSKLD